MKKYILFILFFYAFSASAQKINEIILFQNSSNFIINITIEDLNLSLYSNGSIASISKGYNSNKNPFSENAFYNIFSFYGDRNFDYEDKYKYRHKTDDDFNKENRIELYDNFYDYENGKIKSIHGIKFTYNGSFYKYKEGKLKSIGNIDFRYYDDFYSYQKGKTESIGNIKFRYFDDFYKYKSGKLESVKNNSDNIKITIIND